MNPILDHDPDPARRLKIGYVSSDFRNHSVSFFIVPLIEAHDRKAVEIYCYSGSRVPDETTKRIRNSADAWLDIGYLSDDELAGKIRDGQSVIAEYDDEQGLITFRTKG